MRISSALALVLLLLTNNAKAERLDARRSGAASRQSEETGAESENAAGKAGVEESTTPEPLSESPTDEAVEDDDDAEDDDEPDSEGDEPEKPELYRLAEKVGKIYQDTAHPRDLALLEDFQAAVRLLGSDTYTNADVVTYGGGDNLCVACAAFDALRRREPDPTVIRPIIETLDEASNYARYFALRAIEHHADGPVAGLLLSGVDTSWSTNLATQCLRQFLENRFEIDGDGVFFQRTSASDELDWEFARGDHHGSGNLPMIRRRSGHVLAATGYFHNGAAHVAAWMVQFDTDDNVLWELRGDEHGIGRVIDLEGTGDGGVLAWCYAFREDGKSMLVKLPAE